MRVNVPNQRSRCDATTAGRWRKPQLVCRCGNAVFELITVYWRDGVRVARFACEQCKAEAEEQLK